MLTPERKAERLKAITGSDAAAILGVSPYRTALETWQYKTGLAVEPDISETPYVKAGIFLEQAVADWFEHDTGKKLEKDERFLRHKDHFWMAANIDRRVIGESAIWEGKTTSTDKGWGENGENIIPEQYLCQVAHYCAVTDCERAYIAVLIRGVDFRTYTYQRSARLEALLIEKEQLFWDCVQNETPPPATSQDDIIRLYGTHTVAGPIIGTHELTEAAERYKAIKIQLKELQAEQKQLQDKITVYMGQKDTLLSPTGNLIATFKTRNGYEIADTKSLKEAEPELFKKYSKFVNPTRVLAIK